MIFRRAAFIIAVGGTIQAAQAPSAPSAVAVLPNGAAFTLEVAADPEARRRGYMHRDAVGSGEGMLFVFEDDAPHSLWMKNCKVALDMVWLDASFRVVEVMGDNQPCPADGTCPPIVPTAAGRFVIEFAAGTAARESLRVGDTIVVLRTPPTR